MSDPRNVLQSMYEEPHRYANFGEVITYLYIQGFRCHNGTLIEIESPITAFCGLNGTGKSTILQLAAAAYKNIYSDRRYYIKDFIVAGTLDPSPFSSASSIEYGYWQESRTIKKIVVTRSDPEKRWVGYKRQPSKAVYLAGMSLYLPKIEIRDFVIRNANKVSILSKESLPLNEQKWACKILGCAYDSMEANKVNHAGKTRNVTTVIRTGNQYSEANMGCGEGRIQHIIRTLETLPDKSLVLLEEPETSLHPSAQHEFGKYLLEVCIRKKHQVLITTHSEYLLSALPSASRVYLDRTPTDVKLIQGITTAQAISLMTGGHDKALYILVEDDVAEAVLTEIFRRADPIFLKSIRIHQSGDTKTIQSVMKALKETELPVAAVRDGDKEGNSKENLFKLPGSLPPEIEIFNSPSVHSYLHDCYGIIANDFLASVEGVDHHELFERLSDLVSVTRLALVQELARVYAYSIQEVEADSLTKLLKEAAQK